MLQEAAQELFVGKRHHATLYLASYTPRVAISNHFEQNGGAGFKQQSKERLLVLPHQRNEPVRNAENQVIVGNRQQFLLPREAARKAYDHARAVYRQLSQLIKVVAPKVLGYRTLCVKILPPCSGISVLSTKGRKLGLQVYQNLTVSACT